ncbi:MAG: hypothetical protein UT86_C0002G0125 [Candidatus Magasanikbacteria bacterium GW2011_GWC2_40_17]|uniref:Uncharacterized protein n=1 Tax=Candidatus Magasanikbacteria bacterium GW2011_GWA2_42_32 TaxID=1619039 RepID=A0A0G1CFD3_9BACT|nr:MAG: hypothetical protein UT86_C0002G0125 [Candidatus Magasanikbacteria bacterium GW2011_GWC2_40_17]KKS57286.1 MAG: hypothetical protein UV20_C0002G0075 [Candidatus Magasanikbacteria bacterium GW2011_GWA2_42_32]
MVEDLLEVLKEVVESDELFEVLARATKKAYDAMVKAGFTEEQATRIVAGQGVGFKS